MYCGTHQISSISAGSLNCNYLNKNKHEIFGNELKDIPGLYILGGDSTIFSMRKIIKLFAIFFESKQSFFLFISDHP